MLWSYPFEALPPESAISTLKFASRAKHEQDRIKGGTMLTT